ncbi:MAG: hypothetical protein DRO14_01020 [Thermoprotei archaeon]|nr:MAG: hypothetical protein DRO14_01020 [Thermoprotei archaeon]
MLAILSLIILLYGVSSLAGLLMHKKYGLAIKMSSTISAIASLALFTTSIFTLLGVKAAPTLPLKLNLLILPIYIDYFALFMLALLGLLGVSTAIYSISYME